MAGSFAKHPPRTRAATLTLVGCVLAIIGGGVLGNLKWAMIELKLSYK